MVFYEQSSVTISYILNRFIWHTLWDYEAFGVIYKVLHCSYK